LQEGSSSAAGRADRPVSVSAIASASAPVVGIGIGIGIGVFGQRLTAPQGKSKRMVGI